METQVQGRESKEKQLAKFGRELKLIAARRMSFAREEIIIPARQKEWSQLDCIRFLFIRRIMDKLMRRRGTWFRRQELMRLGISERALSYILPRLVKAGKIESRWNESTGEREFTIGHEFQEPSSIETENIATSMECNGALAGDCDGGTDFMTQDAIGRTGDAKRKPVIREHIDLMDRTLIGSYLREEVLGPDADPQTQARLMTQVGMHMEDVPLEWLADRV